VVWGDDDRLILLANGRRETSKLPQSRFVVIPQAGHIPMEERPEEWLRIVLPFLEGQK
jgi:pimeloyl-ACP methyl ester carboxylesterase